MMGEWGSEGLQVHDGGVGGYRYVMGEQSFTDT